MDTNINFVDHHQETRAPNRETKGDEEEEEAISLSNFPLTSDELEKKNSSTRRSSSEPSDFFEFFNDFSSDRYMSHAEDIIFGGKLVPYYRKPTLNDEVNISKRYCESLPELNHSSRIALMQSSRSLDCKKPRRISSRQHVMNYEVSNNHFRNNKKSEGLNKVILKPSPRWYVLMFGMAPEMDLQDIKTRQFRRSPVSLFPEMAYDRERVPTRRLRRSWWGHDLIKALSCKSHASVAVSTSIGGIITG